ncbi:MAG TPA: hypothetical protein VFU23_03305 [Gemmatimonadales bacterium]|nr:hypothetical protein [Gemmatimonadales bacterium]
MATRKTAQAISDRPGPDAEQDIPEWAKSPSAGSESAPDPIVGQVASATPALDNLLEWLVAEAADESEGSAAGMEAIVRQALSADSPAAVLRQTLPQSGSDFVEIPMLLLDFTIRESDFEGSSSLPFYASMQVMIGEPPEPRVINTGSIKVLAQLKRLRELGEWPQVVQLLEAKKAKKGQNAPLTLAPVLHAGAPAQDLP